MDSRRDFLLKQGLHLAFNGFDFYSFEFQFLYSSNALSILCSIYATKLVVLQYKVNLMWNFLYCSVAVSCFRGSRVPCIISGELPLFHSLGHFPEHRNKNRRNYLNLLTNEIKI